ncbi:MAG: hypothetical protein GY714_10110 [Desulfobacterales bacterium]|nr:hypothetical protein [Desulfobacterales bacterium]MCP4159735.1 hypothetical protein [Deltaproteobacteria bacterium]
MIENFIRNLIGRYLSLFIKKEEQNYEPGEYQEESMVHFLGELIFYTSKVFNIKGTSNN